MNMKNLVIYLLLYTPYRTHINTFYNLLWKFLQKKKKKKKKYYGHTQLVCHVSCSLLAQLKKKLLAQLKSKMDS